MLKRGSASVCKNLKWLSTLANKSRKFTIKTFDDVKIGNIITSPNDRNLYYIFEKHIEERKWTNNTSKISYIFEHLKGEPIDLDKVIPKIEGPISGTLQNIDRANTKTFLRNQIFFKPYYLTLDKDDNTKYFHDIELKEGNIVLNLNDNKYYLLLSFQVSEAMEYGGATYDSSYFNVVEVDPKNNFEIIDIQKIMKLNVGDWSMSHAAYYAVVDEPNDTNDSKVFAKC